MDLLDYLRALRRRWWIPMVCVAIGVALVFSSTPAEPPPPVTTYQAAHTLLISSDPASGGSASLPIGVNQFPLFATTGEVPRRVAAAVGWDGPPAALAAQIQVVVDQAVGTVRFVTTQSEPDRAVEIADAFATAFVEFLAEQQDRIRQARLNRLVAQLEQQTTQIEQLDQRLIDTGGFDAIAKAERDAVVRAYSTTYEQYQALQAEQGSTTVGLVSLEAAQPVAQVTGGFSAPRSRAGRLPLAVGVGLFLGVGLALLIDRYDSKLRTRRQAENAFDAVVVAELPTLAGVERRRRTVLVTPEAQNPTAEAFRTLRTSLTLLSAARAQRAPLAPGAALPAPGAHLPGVVVITSPGPGEGKSTTAANLAAAFAEAGHTAILVNADFRRPTLEKYFTGHGTVPSLDVDAPLLEGALDVLLVDTGMERVQLLDLSGVDEATPGDLSRLTARLLAGLRRRADVVIVDTPPLAVTAEALEYLPEADLLLMIARLGVTTTGGAERASDLVRHAGLETFAVVLNDTGRPRRRRNRYYGYYGRGKAKRRHAAPPSGRRTLAAPLPVIAATNGHGSSNGDAGPNGDTPHRPSEESREGAAG